MWKWATSLLKRFLISGVARWQLNFPPATSDKFEISIFWQVARGARECKQNFECMPFFGWITTTPDDKHKWICRSTNLKCKIDSSIGELTMKYRMPYARCSQSHVVVYRRSIMPYCLWRKSPNAIPLLSISDTYKLESDIHIFNAICPIASCRRIRF